MTIRSGGNKRKNTTMDWLWLFAKIAVAGAALGFSAGWLKEYVAPESRWFIYPAFFVLFLAISIPLVFGVRIKFPGVNRENGAHRDQ